MHFYNWLPSIYIPVAKIGFIMIYEFPPLYKSDTKQDSRNFHIMNMWFIQKTPECLKTKVYEKLYCHFYIPCKFSSARDITYWGKYFS